MYSFGNSGVCKPYIGPTEYTYVCTSLISMVQAGTYEVLVFSVKIK